MFIALTKPIGSLNHLVFLVFFLTNPHFKKEVKKKGDNKLSLANSYF